MTAAPVGVPRRLWSFWHDGRPPLVPRDALARARAAYPDAVFRLLTDDDLPADRPDVRALAPPHRADWARLRALSAHGGLWLDAAVVVLRPAAWPDWDDGAHEWQGFALGDAWENWAFACPAGSAFVGAWFAEFDRAVRLGFDRWAAATVPPAARRALPSPGLPYLTMHAAGLVVRARRARIGRPVRAAVRDAAAAPDGPLAWHAACGWNSVRVVHAALHRRAGAPPLLKLRGWEAWGAGVGARLGGFDPAAAVPAVLGWGPVWAARRGALGAALVAILVLGLLWLAARGAVTCAAD